MIFIKKMCVLRQMRAGFSGDGKQVGGVVKAEQYGKNLAVEVSVVGFAPLAAGEYYCLIADSENRTELLPLRGKSLFNLISDLDVSGGFCAVICLVKNGITPLAYGVSGDKEYDFDALLCSVAPKSGANIAATQVPETETCESYAAGKENAEEQSPPPASSNKEKRQQRDSAAQQTAAQQAFASADKAYDDEQMAEADYYSAAKQTKKTETGGKTNDGFGQTFKRDENAGVTDPDERESAHPGAQSEQDENAENIRRAFDEDGQRYYRSVKDEIDEIFAKYETDDTLSSAFPFSRWARVKEDGKKEYLIGVIYEDGAPLYICYAFPAENKDDPPEDIAEVCAFVPISPFEIAAGCFVIFQSTSTGECVKLKEA